MRWHSMWKKCGAKNLLPHWHKPRRGKRWIIHPAGTQAPPGTALPPHPLQPRWAPPSPARYLHRRRLPVRVRAAEGPPEVGEVDEEAAGGKATANSEFG